jgi:hypothetical protein
MRSFPCIRAISRSALTLDILFLELDDHNFSIKLRGDLNNENVDQLKTQPGCAQLAKETLAWCGMVRKRRGTGKLR